MMSAILYVAGAILFLIGLAAIAFGSPASALDFGNTLIVAGTTSSVGGLIVIGLGAVVSRLQRIADNLGVVHAVEHIEPAIAVPPRPPRPEPRAEPKPFEPRGPSTPPEFPPFMVRKTAEAAREEPERAPSVEPPLSDASAGEQAAEPAEEAKPAAAAEKPAAELPPKSFFESVWPEEKSLVTPKREPAPETPRVSEPAAAPELPDAKKPEEKLRVAAVLKSGVVDGMGYTLYVDGSIEAELPQGTVRFASIQDLRSHLEKSG